MHSKCYAIIGVGLVALASCAAPEAPVAIYPEPVFDKYGNASCRPPDQPIGSTYSAELPLCYVPPEACEPGGRYATNYEICPPTSTADNGDDDRRDQPSRTGDNPPPTRQ